MKKFNRLSKARTIALLALICGAFASFCLIFSGRSSYRPLAKSMALFLAADTVDLDTGSVFDSVDVGADVSTGNFFKGTFSLGSGSQAQQSPGIGLTQANQLRFSVTTQASNPGNTISCVPFAGVSEVKAYVVATVLNDASQNLRTLFTKRPRDITTPFPCGNYKCRSFDKKDILPASCESPSSAPSCPDDPFGNPYTAIYPFKVSFISKPQPLGDMGPGETKTFSLDEADVRELQLMLDSIGAENIRMGVGITQDVLNLDTALSTAGTSTGFSISPASRDISASGGSGGISVAAARSASYWKGFVNSIGFDSNWLRMTSGDEGVGSATLSYVIDDNQSNPDQFAPRSNFVTVAGKTFTVNQASPCSRTSSISIGQTVQGNLASGDCSVNNFFGDLYSFNGSAGQEIDIALTTTSAALDPYLLFYDRNGRLRASDNNGGEGTNARIPAGGGKMSLPYSGMYYIAVRSESARQTGPYSLTLTGTPNCLGISSPPANQTVCLGANTQFTATVSGSFISVQWQERLPGCSAFTDIFENASATTGTLRLLNVASKMNGARYRAKFTSACGETITPEASLTINEPAILPTSRTIAFSGGTGSVAVTTPGGSCSWTASSDSPWISITGGRNGTGNGAVNYSVTGNSGQGRVGRINIGGLSFIVLQGAQGTILSEGFSNVLPNLWSISNGELDNFTWGFNTTANLPIGSPFTGAYAFADSRFSGNARMNEELISPTINGYGCNQVQLEFSNQFQWGGGNEVADVDVSVNAGLKWTNVIHLQGGHNGYPTPNTRTANLRTAISANPLNTTVRFHYVNPNSTRWWAIDNVRLTCVNCPTVTVTPEILQAAPAGSSYSQTFAATGGTPSYTFTIAEGSLPPNMNLAPTGLLSGTPLQQGSFRFTVRATDVNGCSGTRAYTLTVSCPNITISPATIPSGTVGRPYSQPLTPAGGTGPYTCGVVTGGLPAGVTLTNCALSGVPTAAGTVNFTVRATDANGCAGSRDYSLTIIPPEPSTAGLQYYPLPSPIRLLDTRAPTPGFPSCIFQGQPIPAGGEIAPSVFISCTGIPNTAMSLVGNATVISPEADGYATIYPNGQARPPVSNLNFVAGQIIPNAFTVGINKQGEFRVFSTARTDFVIDITGYFAPPGFGGLYYHALPRPLRLYDTRPPSPGFPPCESLSQPIPAGGELLKTAHVTNCDGLTIPSSAVAILGNATAILPSSEGYATLYPDGQSRPAVSNLNYRAGQITPNAFTVGLDPAGRFRLFTTAQADFIVDITGYYSVLATDVNGPGLLYYPLTAPIRLFDTRVPDPNFTPCEYLSQPISAGGELVKTAHLSCQGQIIPAAAQAVVGNATAILPSGAGFVTIYPDGQSRPPVSNLNYLPGNIIPNAFTVGLSGFGRFRVYTLAQLDFIVDLTGYYAP